MTKKMELVQEFEQSNFSFRARVSFKWVVTFLARLSKYGWNAQLCDAGGFQD